MFSCFQQAFAQQEEIMEVVQSVFTGMATDNGQMVQNAFTTDAKLFTVAPDKEGVIQLKEGSLQKFVDAVNGEKKAPYNEPIWNEQVQIDGSFAAVWVDYAFYLGNQFLHCGVDAFHLVEDGGDWKIFHLTDTRRKEGCKVPAKIRRQYEK